MAKILNSKMGERSAIISALGNLMISILKIFGGFVSGSVGLLSDGVHSLADVLSSVIVWIGLKISSKPPDVEHPYGHYKAENIASFFVALFIVLAGVETLWDSISKFFVEQVIILNLWIFSIPLISSFISFLLAEYKKIVGRKIGSPSLIAEGEHSLVDTIASLSVFAGLILFEFGFPIGDPLIGIFISILIVWRGIEIGRDSIYALMDTFRDPVVLERIKSIVDAVPGVIDVMDIRARSAGGRILVELVVVVPPEVKATRLYTLQREIVERIRREIPQIVQVTVEIRPLEEEKKKIAIPINSNEGLNSGISDHFGRAPYIALVSLDKSGEIEKLEVLKNRFLSQKKGIGADLAEFLAKQGSAVVIVKNIGKTSFKLLRSYGLSVYKTPSNLEKLREILKAYVDNRLEIVREEDLREKNEKH